MSKIFSIAIDGPAGAGKSTVAKRVAEALDAVYLDTGAMYRTMGLYMKNKGYDSPDAIARAVNEPEVEIRFVGADQHMILDGEDVTGIIRTPEASMLASKVGGVKEVRTRMVALQREFAEGNSVVMDGRDIGTDVLPNATLKIFLTASCEVRAQRRHKELLSKGKDEPFEKVLKEIVERDYNDSHRAASPMRQAEDAALVDTSDMTQDEVVADIVNRLKKAIGE